MAAAGESADWEVLQIKIFTRWANQKLLSARKPIMQDVVADLGKDDYMENLLQVLSEREMPRPKGGTPKKSILAAQKAQRIEAINQVLSFAWDCGVDMKLKPSAENIYAGDKRDTLSFVWALMMKYMKFDEDEDGQGNLSAKDALLKWLQFHTSAYKSVQIANLTKSFHSGVAFVALIHKFRPELVPSPDTLNPENALANLQLAMNAAEKWLGLEQYIQPKEIAKLDEKSALVYVSEYYYGINEQARRELAAKRISKLINFTSVNDEMRAQYLQNAATLVGHLSKSEELLADISTIDNTMAGAKRRLENFNKYKTGEKPVSQTLHLALEEAYNTLALRLAQNSRPKFEPQNKDLQLAALAARLKNIQAKDVVEPALYQELNRQIKLAQMDKRHDNLAHKLQAWIKDKHTYLTTKVPVSTSGEARKQLMLCDGFFKERTAMLSSSVTGLQEIGATLQKEKFEGSAAVAAREAAVTSGFAELNTLGLAKKPVLEDDLARELCKEKTHMWVKLHRDIFDNLTKWAADKKAYLKAVDTKKVTSVNDAKAQLNQHDAYKREKEEITNGEKARLVRQGQDICNEKYKSSYSSWQYEHPEAVTKLHSDVDSHFAELDKLSETARTALNDALAREQFKEKVLLSVGNHKELYGQIQRWAEEKNLYLGTQETITSSAEARNHLSLLESYQKAKAVLTSGSVDSLNKLGAEIRAAHYKTDLSEWRYEHPQALTQLESDITQRWQNLDVASKAKAEYLDDALKHHLYAEDTRLMNAQHVNKHQQCVSWAELKTVFLESSSAVKSIGEAEYHLNILESFRKEKDAMSQSAVASLKQLGKDILARQYSSPLSMYAYEKPDEVRQREASVDQHWQNLDALTAGRFSALQDALAREKRKEELRLQFADQAGDFQRFTAEKIDLIGSAEDQKTLFGTTLEDVLALGPALDKEDAAIAAAIKAKVAAYTATAEEMKSLECADNPYTDLDTAKLHLFQGNLEEAVSNRRVAYVQEKERQQQNDAACSKYAAVIVPFATAVAKQMAEVLNSTAKPEDQLALVNAHLSSTTLNASTLGEAERLENEVAKRGVVINVHTNLRTAEVSAMFNDYQNILQRKKPYLEKLIEYEKYRGITPAQYQEMDTMFRQYDKDKSGRINPRELRTCLYSLGEERSKAEIAKYMEKFGKNNELNFEAFRELMVTLLGDAGTRESMLESFFLVSKGKDFVTLEELSFILSKEDTAYLNTNAPKVAGGLDFTAWVTDACSR